MWHYVCPVGQGCRGWIPGPASEERAKQVVSLLLNDPDSIVHLTSTEQAQADLQRELKALQTKRQRAINSLVELERRYTDATIDEVHKLDDEVYRRVKTQYQAQAQWASDRTAELNSQLANLQHQAQVLDTLKDMREQLLSKMSDFSTAEWRRLFTDLGLSVHLEEDGKIVCHCALPYKQAVQSVGRIVSSVSSDGLW